MRGYAFTNSVSLVSSLVLDGAVILPDFIKPKCPITSALQLYTILLDNVLPFKTELHV